MSQSWRTSCTAAAAAAGRLLPAGPPSEFQVHWRQASEFRDPSPPPALTPLLLTVGSAPRTVTDSIIICSRLGLLMICGSRCSQLQVERSRSPDPGPGAATRLRSQSHAPAVRDSSGLRVTENRSCRQLRFKPCRGTGRNQSRAEVFVAVRTGVQPLRAVGGVGVGGLNESILYNEIRSTDPNGI